MCKWDARRHKGDLERQKLAWRRDVKLRSLEHVRNYLDKLSKIIGEADGVEFWDGMAGKEDNEASSRLTFKLEDLQDEGAALDLRVADWTLRDLLLKLRLNREDVLRSPYLLFGDDFKENIRNAYKRVDELEKEA